MRFSSFFTLAGPLLVSAAPLKRGATDVLVLQFANVLEQLESQFYTQALAQFQDSDFQAAGFTLTQIPIQEFQIIEADESTHASILESSIISLGAETIKSCKFDFTSVLIDVTTMAATARLVENLGVAAYLGAVTVLTDPVLASAAASILTIEARHQTVLNILAGVTAIPQPFDLAFNPSEVLAIAGAFISGCDVGVTSNPPLAIINTGSVVPGTQLQFKADAINGSIPQDQLFCQMLAGGMTFSISLPLSNCVVPDGLNGPIAIFVTNDGQPLLGNVIDRAQVNIVAGPTMAFIDTQPEILGQLVRQGSSGAGTAAASTTTQTITPAEASAIIASVSSSASSSASSSTPTNASSNGTSPATPPATPANAVSSPGASTSGMPNLYEGPSPDGNTNVNGWTNLSPS